MLDHFSAQIMIIFILSSIIILKVGFWSSYSIIILLIYFLNCRKALFTRREVSLSKRYRFKCFRLAVLLGIPWLCCAHQLALFLYTRQKLTTQLSSCCIAFWGNVYPFTMSGPPGELMTTEKLISREWNQKSPTYWHVAKLFLESEFQHKENKQTKKTQKFSAKSCGFIGSNSFRKYNY